MRTNVVALIALYVAISFTSAKQLMADQVTPTDNRKFSNCSHLQQESLRSLELRTIQMGQDLIEKVSTAAQDHNRPGRLPENDRKLHRSAGLLTCAIKHIGTLDYICISGKRYDAETNWAFAKVIRINETFWKRDDQSRAAAILHEHSHKCGTTDATYFRNNAPHDTEFTPWPFIADTYEYWGHIQFCIPGETCN